MGKYIVVVKFYKKIKEGLRAMCINIFQSF